MTLTRGRPLPVAGAGSAYRWASASKPLTNVNHWPCQLANRASSWQP